ncbi:MAG: hypothetical protein GX383_06960 [Clostridium sp.]|jgi:hypothetical protein|nr:hypothetical protein [Clostridium sp.]
MVSAIIPGVGPKSYAYMNEENIIKGCNGFIEYLVDKNDGRFIIRTVEGIPQKDQDDNKKKLNSSIELALKYDEATVQNEDNLAIYYYNEQFNKWQYLGGEVDKEAKEVRIKLNHLSKYTLIEDESKDKFIFSLGGIQSPFGF